MQFTIYQRKRLANAIHRLLACVYHHPFPCESEITFGSCCRFFFVDRADSLNGIPSTQGVESPVTRIRWEADDPMHCTIPAKLFQKPARSARFIIQFRFSLFYNFATFIPKAATFISKTVIFIYLIFN